MKKLGKIKMFTIATLAAIALAGSIALAQTAATTQKQGDGAGWQGNKGHRGGRRWGHGRGGMFRGINLTDDQKARMQQMGKSFAETTKPLREQLHAKRQELRQLNEGGFNEAVTTQKLQEMAGLEAKLMGERIKQHQEMLSILTPEQKTQLEQKRAEFKNKRGERNERRED